MNRIARIRRIKRLLEHFRRIRDEKAGLLAGAEVSAMAKRREVAELHAERGRTNAYLTAPEGRAIDVWLMQSADAYKRRLKLEMDLRKTELHAVEADVAQKRHETTEAHRTHRVWEIVKGKLTDAENDDAIHRSQRELDELAQQKQHHPSPGSPSGIKRRTQR